MYRIGRLRIDATHLTVYANGSPLPVGPRVVATLVALCERGGEIVGKDELVRRVWPDGCVDASSLWQNVHLARRLLRVHAGCDGIENVRGRGYRLTVPVSVEKPGEVSVASSGTKPARPLRARVAHIAVMVAAVLALVAAPGAGPSRSRAAGSASSEGLRLYRLGRYYLNLRAPQSALRSMRTFQREIGVDRRSALGYAGVADAAYVLALMYEGEPSGRRFRGIAATAARRAVALEPGSADAQTAYAATYEYVIGRFGVADANYGAALNSNPAYAPAHLRYGISLLVRGRAGDAIAQLREAAQLEPVSVINNFWLAWALYATHQPAAAERYARVALDLGPHDDDVRELLARIYEQNREFGKARAMNRIVAACCPRIVRAMAAETYAASGDAARARAELNRIALDSKSDVGLWMNVAFAQLALHDRDGALRSLGHVRLDTARDRSLFALDPRLDAVRDDPRFAPWTHISA